MVGRTLALLLAKQNLRVALVVPPADDRANPSQDVRAYALNAASKALLTALTCWPDTPFATPVLTMQVRGDGAGEVSFSAAALHVPALAWVVDVPVLEAQLAQAVAAQPLIALLDTPAPARLRVICEGRASATRAALGVAFEVQPYAQQAVAARLRCQRPHAQVARQWFANGEVLAFLPLDGADGCTVSVIWSLAAAAAPTLLASSAQDFCHQLRQTSQDELGSLELLGPRRAWPLQAAQAQHWCGVQAGQSWVLAGDAAHTVHPLAGQGLNLGLGDAAELAHVLGQRDHWRTVNDKRLLRRYERARKAALLTMGGASDGLYQLFAMQHGPWKTWRNWGMQGFERSWGIKPWVARQAFGAASLCP